ncbi:hypothetical protein C8J57DRAFT_1560925 [Mycena rebaudengoi]|nr:hypothetical protein C8J57DRAFT_1560925 [Mycena rebaudengoi]
MIAEALLPARSPHVLTVASLVSKHFQLLCFKILYEEIHLVSPRAVVQCCRTILSFETTALVVRSFTLDVSVVDTFPALYDLVTAAFARTSGLRYLCVNELRFIRYVLTESFFPQLESFESFVRRFCHPELVKFFAPHPTIQFVVLQLTVYPFFDSSTGILPNLARF